MKLNSKVINIELARRCVSASFFMKYGIAQQTITRAMNGADITPRTVGKFAKALDVDVTEIIAEE